MFDTRYRLPGAAKILDFVPPRHHHGHIKEIILLQRRHFRKSIYGDAGNSLIIGGLSALAYDLALAPVQPVMQLSIRPSLKATAKNFNIQTST